jgi:hypothetical protein
MSVQGSAPTLCVQRGGFITISFCVERLVGRKGLFRAGAARRYPTSKASQNNADQAQSLNLCVPTWF